MGKEQNKEKEESIGEIIFCASFDILDYCQRQLEKHNSQLSRINEEINSLIKSNDTEIKKINDRF